MLSSNGSLEGGPDFNNDIAWRHPNNGYPYGQCTWFAAGRLYEIYGIYDSRLSHGDKWVGNLVRYHPDVFEFSFSPKPGAIFSAQSHPHVGLVVAVNGNKITVQEGNLNQTTDSWEVAIEDWQEMTYTFEEFERNYGQVQYANPINSPVQ